MESLKDACIKFIEPRMTASNCTGLIHSFKQYGLTRLLNKAIGFCLENFDLVCKTPRFLDIEEDIWEILLPDEGLNLSESGIFRALVKWTEHDSENRQVAFGRLVKHLRFATIALSELNKLTDLKLATTSQSCKELIARAKYNSETGRQDKQSEDEPVPDVSATPRLNLKNRQRMYAIGGCRFVQTSSLDTSDYHPESTDNVQIYDPKTDKWTEAAPMYSPRRAFGCTVLGDYIYVAGGEHDDELLESFERYSIANDTWESLPDMIEPRRDLGLVALNGDIYAMGGVGDLDRLNRVERWYSDDKDWGDCAGMLIRRVNAAYVALDGYIYAIGGDGPEFLIATIEKYDPEADSWCRLAYLDHVRDRYECTTYEGMIYIMCWNNRTRHHLHFFVYNVATDQYSDLPNMPTKRFSFKMAELGRELYAVGGRKGKLASNIVESYNPETKQWTARTAMKSKLAEHSLIVHPERNFPDKHLLAPLVEK